MVRLLGALAAITLLTSCSETDWREAKTSFGASVTEEVKYRTANDGLVPLHMDKYFDKDVALNRSRDIRVAGYDKENSYFVICFKRTCYHYCRFPESIWETYKTKTNLDYFYEDRIKGNFDCRSNGGKYVPVY